jgi:hypothetical protein
MEIISESIKLSTGANQQEQQPKKQIESYENNGDQDAGQDFVGLVPMQSILKIPFFRNSLLFPL